jgi:hypothetical protein
MMKFYRQGARRILAGQKKMSTILITLRVQLRKPCIRKMLTGQRISESARWPRLIRMELVEKLRIGVDNEVHTRRRAKRVLQGRSEPFGPSTGGVKHPQYFHGIIADAIGEDVGDTGNEQFASAGYPSGSAQGRVAAKFFHSPVDGCYDSAGSRRVFTCNEFGFSIQVG